MRDFVRDVGVALIIIALSVICFITATAVKEIGARKEQERQCVEAICFNQFGKRVECPTIHKES